METAELKDLKVEIFFPLYVGDYDRDTADLSFEEHGFYGAILRALWVRGGVLQAGDKQRMARILRTDVATFDRLWPSVHRFFTFGADGTFHQKRLSAELEKAKQNKAFAVERARKGGLARASLIASSSASSSASSTPQAELGAVLQASTSPSPSPSPSESTSPSTSPRSGARARWAPSDWLSRFGLAWNKTYQGRFYGGGAADGVACGKLEELLKHLPGPERKAAEDRSETMFAEFLGDQSSALLRERHPFSFFVQRWNGLRVPQLNPRAPPEGKPRDPRVGSIPAPGPGHQYPRGAQPL